jgi:hypothetical protein
VAPPRGFELGKSGIFHQANLRWSLAVQAKSQKRKNPGKPGFFEPKQMFG